MTLAPTREEMTAATADPLVDAAAAVLGVPVCHLYAVLWRAGLLTILE
ncbi:Rv1535 domain-containing protein [Mycobacterium sp.]|nr:Rv1535 domain-containing protein [Mycobacterium sp.]HME49505.1 Rv1535 domain-containing protein [Mycobacterium sp.]